MIKLCSMENLDKYYEDYSPAAIQMLKAKRMLQQRQNEKTQAQQHPFFGTPASMVITMILFMISVAIFCIAVQMEAGFVDMFRISLLVVPINIYMIARSYILCE
jgi:hypothetical protein